jgi:DNA mismatch repair protein MSH2
MQGLRLLSRWLQQPLRDKARLEERLDVVEALRSDPAAMESLSKDYLRGVPDLQSLSRKLQRRKASLLELYK